MSQTSPKKSQSKTQALFQNLTRLSYVLLASAFIAWALGSIQIAYLIGLLSVVMMMASSILKFAQNLLGVSGEVFSPDQGSETPPAESSKEGSGGATAPR